MVILSFIGNTTDLQNHLDKHHRHQIDLPSGSSQPEIKKGKIVQPAIYQQLMHHPVEKYSFQKKIPEIRYLVQKLIVGKVL